MINIVIAVSETISEADDPAIVSDAIDDLGIGTLKPYKRLADNLKVTFNRRSDERVCLVIM
jgi:hypothetical protein